MNKLKFFAIATLALLAIMISCNKKSSDGPSVSLTVEEQNMVGTWQGRLATGEPVVVQLNNDREADIYVVGEIIEHYLAVWGVEEYEYEAAAAQARKRADSSLDPSSTYDPSEDPSELPSWETTADMSYEPEDPSHEMETEPATQEPRLWLSILHVTSYNFDDYETTGKLEVIEDYDFKQDPYLEFTYFWETIRIGGRHYDALFVTPFYVQADINMPDVTFGLKDYKSTVTVEKLVQEYLNDQLDAVELP